MATRSRARRGHLLRLCAIVAGAWILAECSAPPDADRAPSQPTRTTIVVPKIWDEQALARWATPVAGLGVRPGHFSEAEYYAAPIDNLRTYPVYHPDFEPAGYRKWMLAEGPKPLIEPERLETRADWLEAGRRVFEELDTAVTRSDDPVVLEYFSDAAAIDAHRDATHDALTRDGIILDYRWVVDSDRKLKIGVSSCSGCHTRLLPDGTLLRGAPCNFDLADTPAADVLLSKFEPKPELTASEVFYQFFGVPWLSDDPHAKFKTATKEEMQAFHGLDTSGPSGATFARFNGSPLFVTRMADLNGIADRRYLDATGTHAHRGPEDIARYGILVEFADNARFGPHQFVTEMNTRIPVRPPDEAMYALGLYVESLQAPKSPHPFDALARRGQEVFEAEECSECHTPPIYTNNKLVAVPGFDPPKDAQDLGLDVSLRRVGTDPGLALKTRKGTGYYKIPSLRGLWYRGLYEHDGSVASLEDWFDPQRLREDYVPSGWKGPGVEHRAVPGHKFGHDLPAEDKKALIAFLLTL